VGLQDYHATTTRLDRGWPPGGGAAALARENLAQSMCYKQTAQANAAIGSQAANGHEQS
jgi:hypothetical protein